MSIENQLRRRARSLALFIGDARVDAELLSDLQLAVLRHLTWSPRGKALGIAKIAALIWALVIK